MHLRGEEEPEEKPLKKTMGFPPFNSVKSGRRAVGGNKHVKTMLTQITGGEVYMVGLQRTRVLIPENFKTVNKHKNMILKTKNQKKTLANSTNCNILENKI